MNDIISSLLNGWVILYLTIIVVVQIALYWHRGHRARLLQRRRTEAGLQSPDVLLDHAQRLSSLRRDALVEAALLVGTVVLVPFLLLLIASFITDGEELAGLATAFLILLLWVLFSNADIGNAWLGGTLFKLLVGFKEPFQVGDRVTLMGHSGRVMDIGRFLVKLQTPDDDLVSIPTFKLWTETLVSANAGDRASLCVVSFYLAPKTSSAQRQQAEDALWNAAQASVYYDFTKQMQIFLSQAENAIVLTLKVYVASTYNEPLFRSDITRAFLDYANEHQLPLAASAWRYSEGNAVVQDS